MINEHLQQGGAFSVHCEIVDSSTLPPSLSAPVCLSKTDLPRNSAEVSNSANTNLTVQNCKCHMRENAAGKPAHCPGHLSPPAGHTSWPVSRQRPGWGRGGSSSRLVSVIRWWIVTLRWKVAWVLCKRGASKS